MFIRNVPYELKNRFKAYCAERRISLRKKILDMMRETLAKEKEIFLLDTDEE